MLFSQTCKNYSCYKLILTYSHNNLCASACIKFVYDLLHHFVQLSIRLLTTGGALADSWTACSQCLRDGCCLAVWKVTHITKIIQLSALPFTKPQISNLSYLNVIRINFMNLQIENLRSVLEDMIRNSCQLVVTKIAEERRERERGGGGGGGGRERSRERDRETQVRVLLGKCGIPN